MAAQTVCSPTGNCTPQRPVQRFSEKFCSEPDHFSGSIHAASNAMRGATSLKFEGWQGFAEFARRISKLVYLLSKKKRALK